MNLFRKFFTQKKLHIEEDKMKILSSLILGEEYKNFEKYIILFYNNREKYKEKIIENNEIWQKYQEQTELYLAMKSFAVYKKKVVIVTKEEMFSENLEWNRAAEIFDFLFEETLSNDIILEVLRKCFFSYEEYSVGRFFHIIDSVLNRKGLRMYFIDEETNLFLFFILEGKYEKKIRGIVTEKAYKLHSIKEYF